MLQGIGALATEIYFWRRVFLARRTAQCKGPRHSFALRPCNKLSGMRRAELRVDAFFLASGCGDRGAEDEALHENLVVSGLFTYKLVSLETGGMCP